MNSIEKRFWAKVDKSGDCWSWTAGKSSGYGRFFTDGSQKNRYVYAHRFSWELHNGPIPNGLQVLHQCDNPPCVKPGHLFLGTHAVNMADMAKKKRCHYKKLSRADAEEIRGLIGKEPYRVIGSRFGVSAQMVCLIAKGRAHV